MNKLVRSLWILLLALLIIILQIKFYNIFSFVSESFTRAMSYRGSNIILGLWLGLLFGLIGCPVCGVPLVAYSLGAEKFKTKSIVFAGILFNFSRFIVFFILGILSGLIGETIVKNKLNIILPFISMSVGAFLIILSLDLFNILNLRAYLTQKLVKFITREKNFNKLNVQHPIEYGIWGSMLGVICTMEGFAFAMPVWLNGISSGNILYAVMSMLVFVIGAFMPSISMLAFCSCGLELLSKRIDQFTILKFVRYTGGLVLIFLGTQYIVLGIISI